MTDGLATQAETIAIRLAATALEAYTEEMNKMDKTNWYDKAMVRLDAEPALDAHRDTITSDWNETDHWQWIATAEISEIVAWAEEIEANDAEADTLAELDEE